MTNNWVLRGLVLAAGMLVLRLVQGVLINTFEMHATLINIALLVIFVAGVVVWAYFDGRENAKSHPDPDRRADLAMTWLLAGITAGVLSGAAAWTIALFDPAIYTGGLLNELTGIASFTALLVWVPAMAAVAFGRRQIDKNYEYPPEVHHGLAAEGERADTDVFAAVDPDAQAAGEAVSEAASEEQTTAVATLPDFAPAPSKKRWWQRRKSAATEVDQSAETTGVTVPTAYTMEQTEPVSYDSSDTEATTEITTPAPSAGEEPTTELPTVQPPESDDPEKS